MTVYILIGAAAFVAGVIIAVPLLSAVIKTQKNRRKSGAQKRRFEFSKLVLALVLLTYFIGVVAGVRVVFIDVSQLHILLAYIGAPTGVAIGFYAWKAKAENIVKIRRENPEEAVDINNIHH